MARERSTEEFLGAVRRMMRAAARRVAQGDEFELAEFVALKADYEYCLGQAVAGQRLFSDKSWRQIAEGAGNRPSAAHERWHGVEYELWEIEWFAIDEAVLEA